MNISLNNLHDNGNDNENHEKRYTQIKLFK